MYISIYYYYILVLKALTIIYTNTTLMYTLIMLYRYILYYTILLYCSYSIHIYSHVDEFYPGTNLRFIIGQ